jgi:hypothetical protein
MNEHQRTVTEFIASGIEPVAADIARGVQSPPIGTIAEMSIAISLKRIADAVEAMAPQTITGTPAFPTAEEFGQGTRITI